MEISGACFCCITGIGESIKKFEAGIRYFVSRSVEFSHKIYVVETQKTKRIACG